MKRWRHGIFVNLFKDIDRCVFYVFQGDDKSLIEGKRRFRELVAEELQSLLQRETKEVLDSKLEKERAGEVTERLA